MPKPIDAQTIEQAYVDVAVALDAAAQKMAALIQQIDAMAKELAGLDHAIHTLHTVAARKNGRHVV